MFRTATAFAVAALFCAPAMAQTVAAGQYRGVTQYTGLIDPEGICASQAGLAAGQVSKSVATIAGLGAAWTTTISNTNPSPTAMYGAGWINCAFPALPAASSFSPVTTGAATVYVAMPVGSQVTSCSASNGITYTLTSSNGTLDGQTQTNSATILPTSGNDSGFKVTTSNTAVAVGGSTICFLSTDALYLRSN